MKVNDDHSFIPYIKAFRPGAVDLPNAQAVASHHAITMQDVVTEFDQHNPLLLAQDFNLA